MRLSRFVTAAALVGAASTLGGVSACSRTKPGLSKHGAARAAAAFKTPEASAVALCSAIHDLPQARRATCCAEAPRPLYYDECVRLLSSAVRAGHIEVDAAKLSDCRARVDAETRGCDWISPTLGAAPAECTAAVSGKLAAGERCSSSLECAGDMHCAGQGATSPGTCKPPQLLGAGCGAAVDSLATYLAVRGLEATKPDCADFCSLPSHRCEPVPVAGTACQAVAFADAIHNVVTVDNRAMFFKVGFIKVYSINMSRSVINFCLAGFLRHFMIPNPLHGMD